MITAPLSIWIAVEPMDMHLRIDGLSLRVQQTLGRSPCEGSAYVFRNRRGDRLKLLLWDGNGVWLCQCRPHKSRFVWPQAGSALWSLDLAQWRWLVAGVDWQRLSASAYVGAVEVVMDVIMKSAANIAFI